MKLKNKNFAVLINFVMLALIAACVQNQKPFSEKNSNLTQGNIQLNLVVGKTTKLEVLEKFGAPNITTRDAKKREVWTYQKNAQVTQSNSQENFWFILITGGSKRASGFETTSRTTTLIIKFDENDVVYDFKSRTSNF